MRYLSHLYDRHTEWGTYTTLTAQMRKPRLRTYTPQSIGLGINSYKFRCVLCIISLVRRADSRRVEILVLWRWVNSKHLLGSQHCTTIPCTVIILHFHMRKLGAGSLRNLLQAKQVLEMGQGSSPGSSSQHQAAGESSGDPVRRQKAGLPPRSAWGPEIPHFYQSQN